MANFILATLVVVFISGANGATLPSVPLVECAPGQTEKVMTIPSMQPGEVLFAESCSDIRTLTITDVFEKRLESGILEPLTALTSIDLSSAALTRIEENAFKGLSTLSRLDLQSNLLSSLSTSMLESNTQLTELNLRNNALTSIPEGLFDGVPFMLNLDLSSNSLTSLPDHLFANNQFLLFLKASNNQISELPYGLFDGLIDLLALLIDGNPLTCLPPIPNDKVILQADVTPMPVCPMPSPSLLLGDIDSDGDVDIADVIAMSTFLTGGSNGEGMDMEAADMNQDGEVEVQDAVILIDLAVGN